MVFVGTPGLWGRLPHACPALPALPKFQLLLDVVILPSLPSLKSHQLLDTPSPCVSQVSFPRASECLRCRHRCHIGPSQGLLGEGGILHHFAACVPSASVCPEWATCPLQPGLGQGPPPPTCVGVPHQAHCVFPSPAPFIEGRRPGHPCVTTPLPGSLPWGLGHTLPDWALWLGAPARWEKGPQASWQPGLRLDPGHRHWAASLLTPSAFLRL